MLSSENCDLSLHVHLHVFTDFGPLFCMSTDYSWESLTARHYEENEAVLLANPHPSTHSQLYQPPKPDLQSISLTRYSFQSVASPAARDFGHGCESAQRCTSKLAIACVPQKCFGAPHSDTLAPGMRFEVCLSETSYIHRSSSKCLRLKGLDACNSDTPARP